MLLPLKKEIDNYYVFLKVEAHSTHSLGYLVKYIASLIISSLINSDIEEVIYLIRVRRRLGISGEGPRTIISYTLRTRSVTSTIYASVYKTNSGKKHAAILVGNRRGAISNKPTREEGGPLRGRRKRALSDNKEVVPSPLARKSKANTPLNTSWEKGYTSSGKLILNTKQTFAYFQYPKAYSDYNGVKRHFKTSHLTDRNYNFCDLSILHEMHLQRHA
ncbi:Zinc finger C2H2 [Penicillium frequentans]|nr:Zinc finger C2H2 [Penicillium glabrum]